MRERRMHLVGPLPVSSVTSADADITNSLPPTLTLDTCMVQKALPIHVHILRAKPVFQPRELHNARLVAGHGLHYAVRGLTTVAAGTTLRDAISKTVAESLMQLSSPRGSMHGHVACDDALLQALDIEYTLVERMVLRDCGFNLLRTEQLARMRNVMLVDSSFTDMHGAVHSDVFETGSLSLHRELIEILLLK